MKFVLWIGTKKFYGFRFSFFCGWTQPIPTRHPGSTVSLLYIRVQKLLSLGEIRELLSPYAIKHIS